MPAGLGVGVQGNDTTLEGGVLEHDEFAVCIDGMHQVRFDELADFDGVVAADLNLQACSLGEDGLRVPDDGGLGGFVSGRTLLERLCACTGGENESCWAQQKRRAAALGKVHQ
jgi:hypothetical protein